jgi:zinc protease
VTVVEKPTAEATAISLGFPLEITRSDQDFYPLLVANTYLGDHRTFNGVLMNELHKRGLNYGDYSYIEAFHQDGGSTFALPNVSRRQQSFSI